MFKGLMLGMVLLACTCMGRMMSSVRRKRSETLSGLLSAMRVLRLRMLNSLEPLGILLRKADCELFLKLGNSLWECGSLGENWLKLRDAEQKRGGVLVGLSGGDMQILDDFFMNLGKSGRDEQCQLFASVIDRMEENLKNAKASYLDASKLYTALGTLVGIGICILVM